MSKVYITNITSDRLKTDGRPEITNLNLHELICDRQIEGGVIEEQVISVLNSVEYKSVLKNGYYIVDDLFNEKKYVNGKIIPIGCVKR